MQLGDFESGKLAKGQKHKTNALALALWTKLQLLGPFKPPNQNVETLKFYLMAKMIFQPVGLCEWKIISVHPILTILFKNVFRTFNSVEAEILNI